MQNFYQIIEVVREGYCKQHYEELKNEPTCQEFLRHRTTPNPSSNNVTSSVQQQSTKLAINYTKQGWGHYQRGEYRSAISSYNLALLNNPSYDIAYLGRAMAWKKLGNNRNASLDA